MHNVLAEFLTGLKFLERHNRLSIRGDGSGGDVAVCLEALPREICVMGDQEEGGRTQSGGSVGGFDKW